MSTIVAYGRYLNIDHGYKGHTGTLNISGYGGRQNPVSTIRPVICFQQ